MAIRSRTLVAVALAAFASGVLAQETTDDWDATVDAERRLTAAQLEFSNGLGIAVRCVGGRYDALIGGLPPAAEGVETRVLTLRFGEDSPFEQRWNVTRNPNLAVSELPAPFARALRRGGSLQVMLPGAGEGGRNLRYVLDLPPSSAAIDRTLEACDRPLVDPRDAEIQPVDGSLPEGIQWERPPQVEFPSRNRYESGFAVISCLTRPDGRLRECVVESEHPIDGGFGQATLASTEGARVRNAADRAGALPVRRIIYRTNFRDGAVGADAYIAPSSRLRRQP
ncbi:MAG: hypothetical protein B7Z42_07785 [Brevundimonas sp. 12-68-7]|uniref:TonB C-terminal domain-containing protein n=1 Tax=Brevundimonas aurifodinae TaxID=1508312 RepID=A0ABV1NSK7_9CAUL|nr:MAG: hypothetical protein B7Z42_07785 [Brevundimonas sp. 12-68-7]